MFIPGRHCWPAEGRSQVPSAWKQKKTQSPRHLGGVRCFRWLNWRLGRRFRSADKRRHRSLLQRCCLRDQCSLLNRRSFLATEPPSHVVLEPLKSFTNVIQQDPSAVPSSFQRSNLSRNNGVVGGWVSPEDKVAATTAGMRALSCSTAVVGTIVVGGGVEFVRCSLVACSVIPRGSLVVTFCLVAGHRGIR